MKPTKKQYAAVIAFAHFFGCIIAALFDGGTSPNLIFLFIVAPIGAFRFIDQSIGEVHAVSFYLAAICILIVSAFLAVHTRYKKALLIGTFFPLSYGVFWAV